MIEARPKTIRQQRWFQSAVWITLVFQVVWCSDATRVYAANYKGGSGDIWKGSHRTYNKAYLGGCCDGWSSATSADAGMGYGVANHLSFATSPTLTAVNNVFSPQPVVHVLDANNNIVLNSSLSITVALGSNPGSATLSGTANETASSGVANFTGNGLRLDRVGSGFTLVATGSGVTSATSSGFDIIIDSNIYNIHSELTFDQATDTYYIRSWLERNGQQVSDGSWSCSNVTISVRRADSSTAAASQPGSCTYIASQNIFRHTWDPTADDENEIFEGYVTISYPVTDGNTYSGRFIYNPNLAGVLEDIAAGGGGGGFTASDRTTLEEIAAGGGGLTDADRTTLNAIKTKTDTVNWSDISAIKTAVGVSTDNESAATVFGKIADLKKTMWTDQLSKVN